MEKSIYQAPDSDVTQGNSQTGFGSLEQAVTGDYEFSIGGTLSEAWEKTKGAKLQVHLGYLLMMGVLLSLSIVLGIGSSILGFITSFLPSAFSAIILGLVGLAALVAVYGLLAAMWAGLMMIGVERAADVAPNAGTAIKYLKKTWPILGVYLLSTLFTAVGSLLFLIPGIYLAFAYTFALPLRAEKTLSTWAAMETSRKAVTHRWFSFFALGMLLLIINIIAMIPFGLGLIWTIPMSHVAMGIVYRNMFGVEAETLSQ